MQDTFGRHHLASSLHLSSLHLGRRVFDRDGQRLGRIVQQGDGWFLVRQGFWRPRETRLTDADVLSSTRDTVHVRLLRGDLRWFSAGVLRYPVVADTEVEAQAFAEQERAQQRPAVREDRGELRVPVVREEPQVVRRVHQGAVRLRREVVTEMRQITVPVRREVLRVEQVDDASSVSGDDTLVEALPTDSDERSFELELHEDEVQVTTRPVVRERVRVTHSRHTEERRVDVPLRSQNVEVERVPMPNVPEDPTTRH